ncbi:MAG: hydrogenase maturation protease, partial [Actinobacteria bacterium]|nr:hydrogenase maturation protease [Actinomycetota bacterium]
MTGFDKIETVVLGIGNILLGDEGVGVHVVNRLKNAGLPPSVVLIDGATAGFRLLALFEEYSNCNFIIIDALKINTPEAGAYSGLNPKKITRQRNLKYPGIPQKGDIYLIPLKDFYKEAGPGLTGNSSISFHETSLMDVLDLFKATTGNEIKGFLIGINIFNSFDNKGMDLPMGICLSPVIESRISKIIDI